MGEVARLLGERLEIVEEEEGRRGMVEGLRQEVVVGTQEGDAVERRA